MAEVEGVSLGKRDTTEQINAKRERALRRMLTLNETEEEKKEIAKGRFKDPSARFG